MSVKFSERRIPQENWLLEKPLADPNFFNSLDEFVVMTFEVWLFIALLARKSASSRRTRTGFLSLFCRLVAEQHDSQAERFRFDQF